jgi:quinol-cytochrome oxidoreductase complex cytochrome b subunit
MNIFLVRILIMPIITRLMAMLEHLGAVWASTSERQKARPTKTISYLPSRVRNTLVAVFIVLINGAEAMEISNIVDNEKMAVELAEVYIANIYGKQAAERQKPYSVTDVEGYWQIKGVMPKRQLGGTFEIHIAKDNGKILMLRHSR